MVELKLYETVEFRQWPFIINEKATVRGPASPSTEASQSLVVPAPDIVDSADDSSVRAEHGRDSVVASFCVYRPARELSALRKRSQGEDTKLVQREVGSSGEICAANYSYDFVHFGEKSR